MFVVEQNNKLSLSSSAAAMPSDHEQRAGLPTLPLILPKLEVYAI